MDYNLYVMGKKSEIIDVLKTMKGQNTNTFSNLIETHAIKLQDSYGNKILGIGKEDKKGKFNYWSLINSANDWALWMAMYNDSWVFRRAIDKPAQDVVNLSLRFSGTTEDLNSLRKDLNRLNFSLIQLLMWGALFGGSVAVMLFDNIPLEEMETPLDIEKIKFSKNIRLHVLDRWNGIEQVTNDLVTNPTDPDFLKPKFYNLRIGNQSFRIHYSYVLRYEHRIAPNLIRNGELQGWGLPEGLHLINELMRDEKIKNSITSLIDKSLIEVIKMDGMRGVFMGSDQDNQDQLKMRLEMVNWGRNFNSLTFLDTADDYQQNTFGGLSGLSDLMDKNMEIIAAALEMTGVLYGDMSGGFSPDNYALVRYDTSIRNRAESYYRPVLEKLVNVLKFKNGISGEVDFDFESMLQTKEEDTLDKAQKIVGILSTMISDGYMSVAEAAQEVQKNAKELGIGESITDASIQKLKEESDLASETISDSDLFNLKK